MRLQVVHAMKCVVQRVTRAKVTGMLIYIYILVVEDSGKEA